MSGAYEARRFGAATFSCGTAVAEGGAATGDAGTVGDEMIRVNSLGPVAGAGEAGTAGREKAPVANPSEVSGDATGAADEKISLDSGSSFWSMRVNSLEGCAGWPENAGSGLALVSNPGSR